MAKIIFKTTEFFPGQMAMPGILVMMREEHRMITALMENMHTLETEQQLRQCFEQLTQKVQLHAHAEERVFYPAIADLRKTKKMTAQSLQDHIEIDNLLKAINSQGFKSSGWKSLFNDLQNTITEHIKAEEELLFSLLRENFTKYELSNLEKRYKEIKNYGLGIAS